jgi:hypothetical protein
MGVNESCVAYGPGRGCAASAREGDQRLGLVCPASPTPGPVRPAHANATQDCAAAAALTLRGKDRAWPASVVHADEREGDPVPDGPATRRGRRAYALAVAVVLALPAAGVH